MMKDSRLRRALQKAQSEKQIVTKPLKKLNNERLSAQI